MRRFAQATLLAAALLAVAVAGLDRWVAATVLPPLTPATSRLVTDREGVLLRAWPVADGRWRLPVAPEQVDPDFVRLLVSFEDRRFWSHPGLDPLAMLRAAGQALVNGRIVSGASTLTMQVARLLEEGNTGTFGGKLRQIRVALALERRLSKEQILGLYLQLAPYGGNIEGIRSASLTWFGKEPRRLTPAEAALLVALPQSPETRRPDRYPDAAARAREKVLRRALGAGLLDESTAEAALTEAVPTTRQEFPFLAPLLSDRLIATRPEAVITTTIDGDLQASLEALVAEAATAMDPRISVAVIVANYRSGEILAEIGSADYFSEASRGFVDMTRAVRSPGSALKPLIYGLAFEAGIAHPETLVTDRPVSFGTWTPRNFDGQWHGTLTLREALEQSLNIPAVLLLDAVGPAQFLSRLRRAGVTPELPSGGPPGLAIGLGGIGMTLHDLVTLYAVIANGGEAAALHDQPATLPSGARVLSANAAWQVGDILAGVARPAGALNEDIAFKTGTSWGHRDAWAIGFDGAHVIGVWIGRADGTPMPGMLGADTAAPLLFEAFGRLGARPLPAPPPSVLTATNSALPPHLREFRPQGQAQGLAVLEIAFPPDGAKLERPPGGGPLTLRARNGTLPLTWMINGTPLQQADHARLAEWMAEGPGFARITVLDAAGQAARASVYME